MAGTTVHAGRCIVGSGGLIHCTVPQLGVLAAMHCHKRQGTRSAIVAIRAHRSPAQLQRQQYQQENKQTGAGVHPENCSGTTTAMGYRMHPEHAQAGKSGDQVLAEIDQSKKDGLW